jgi:hypothetical protein
MINKICYAFTLIMFILLILSKLFFINARFPTTN